jgi:hypothetical protein
VLTTKRYHGVSGRIYLYELASQHRTRPDVACVVLAVHSACISELPTESMRAGLQDHAAEFSGNHEASIVDIKDFEECL